MKIRKFLLLTVAITLMALTYVHQQFILVKVSYEINANEKKYNQLLDQNKILEYNVSKLKSPQNLNRYENKLQIAKSNQILNAYTKNTIKDKVAGILARRGGLSIFDLFAVKRQAEARTIK